MSTARPSPFRIAALAAALLWLGCASAAAELRVLATMSLLADMAREIGGDRVSATALVGTDGDAHGFEPTPADLRRVAEADLLVSNGLGLDAWILRMIEAAGARGLHVIASAGVPGLAAPADGHDHGHGHGHGHSQARPADRIDPHAWQSLSNGRIYAANIGRALATRDPANADAYAAGLADYDRRLAALDARVRAAIAAIPPDRRKVITSHDAFRYFGAAYGITFLAPVGISTHSEPSAGQLAGLIRQMRREKVKALFVENVSDPRLVAQLAREAGAVIGGKLFSDAPSGPDGPAPTYLRMIEHNLATLVAGMQAN